jgi:hypothetical protein
MPGPIHGWRRGAEVKSRFRRRLMEAAIKTAPGTIVCGIGDMIDWRAPTSAYRFRVAGARMNEAPRNRGLETALQKPVGCILPRRRPTDQFGPC